MRKVFLNSTIEDDGKIINESSLGVSSSHGRMLLGEHPLELELGGLLSPVIVAFECYGTLNAAGTNAVLVCHALTGSAHAFRGTSPLAGWWDGMIGPGMTFDPDRYFIVCSNVVGSCYGSSGPKSIDPITAEPFGNRFPRVTVRDMVRVQYALLMRLGVRQLQAVAGGSLGGMQALEWAVMYPSFVKAIVAIATAARHSPWAIAWNHLQREVLRSNSGLSLARQIAMLSYRSPSSFESRFGRKLRTNGGGIEPLFEVQSFLEHHGETLLARFDANSYRLLLNAMDHHDLSTGRGDMRSVLASIRARVLCIGIDTDILYPPDEQRSIVQSIPRALYAEIRSLHGHDAFLLEFAQLQSIIKPFLEGPYDRS